jgi:hypothetical protein
MSVSVVAVVAPTTAVASMIFVPAPALTVTTIAAMNVIALVIVATALSATHK